MKMGCSLSQYGVELVKDHLTTISEVIRVCKSDKLEQMSIAREIVSFAMDWIFRYPP